MNSASTSARPTQRLREDGGEPIAGPSFAGLESESRPSAGSIPPLRKAAIVLVSLEQSVSSRLLAHLDRDAVEAVTWEIAQIDRVDPDEQAVVLEEFLAMGLRRLCFAFDDLARMDDREIRSGFQPGDLDAWALALAGAAPPLRAKVLGALSGPTAKTLQLHLENLGPFRLSDTEVAQAEIVERFRDLHDLGKIDLPDPNGREEVLV